MKTAGIAFLLVLNLTFCPVVMSAEVASVQPTPAVTDGVGPESSHSLSLGFLSGVPDLVGLTYTWQSGRRYAELGVGWGVYFGLGMIRDDRAQYALLSSHGGIGRGRRLSFGVLRGRWAHANDLYWLAGARVGVAHSFTFRGRGDVPMAGPWASVNLRSVYWNAEGRGPTVHMQFGTSGLLGVDSEAQLLADLRLEGKLELGYTF